MTKKRIEKRRICVTIIFLSSFLVFLFFLSFSFYCFFELDSSTCTSDQANIYQFIETNPITKETRYGVSIFLRSVLKPNEEFVVFTKREDNRRNQVIISKFGEHLYECEGTCFCGNNDVRRKSSVLTNGLFLTLSALSLSVAFTISKETFLENCIQHFSGTCDDDSNGNIFSEVLNCNILDDDAEISRYSSSPTTRMRLMNKEDQDDEETGGNVFSEGKYFLDPGLRLIPGTYSCIGHCIPSDERRRSGKCEDLKIAEKIEVEPHLPLTTYDSYTFIKQVFLKDHMEKFCEEGSCTASIHKSGISCKMIELLDEDLDPTDAEFIDNLFTLGIKDFLEKLEGKWELREVLLKKDGSLGTNLDFVDLHFNFRFRDLYYIMGGINIMEEDEDDNEEEPRFYVDLYNIIIGREYRSQGFFDRMLEELEEWGRSQDGSGLFSIIISDVRNPDFKEYLRKRDFEEDCGNTLSLRFIKRIS